MVHVGASDLVDALWAFDGLLSKAALALGTTRRAIANQIDADASGALTEALAEIRETLLDDAEAHLLANIRTGSSSDIRFYLSTQGKHRGYTTRIETTGVDGGPIRIDLSAVSDADLDRFVEAVAAGPG